jgi:hypothetical protein
MDRDSVLQKLVAMFRPYDGDAFLEFEASDVICGPNDRALFGTDTNFPKAWLVEDFDFTDEEATWLIDAVRSASEAA